MICLRKISTVALVALSAIALPACSGLTFGPQMDMDKVRSGKFGDDVFRLVPNPPIDMDLQRFKDARPFIV